MSQAAQITLHIPPGIRFECSGCGNCCLSWPVPVTDEDVRRIRGFAGEDVLFRPLPPSTDKNNSYTHSLEKRADGRCQFLTQENQCRLHIEHGAAAKPAMCSLFPYTFTPTPSGIFAGLSFASTAVLFNSGRLLTEQEGLLQEKWQLLETLMPGYAPTWDVQLVDGVPWTWSDYQKLDEQLLSNFSPLNDENISLLERCKKASFLTCGMVAKNVDLERNLTTTRPKIVDQILIKRLSEFYFPENVFGDSSTDLPARTIAQELVTPPQAVQMEYDSHKVAFAQLIDMRLGSLSPECEDLMQRFLYCRIFSKLYFSAGFNGLSVLAGLQHAILLIALVRIQLKLRHKSGNEVDITELAELIRTLERRLTDARFGRESVVILEVLLPSPSRIQRVLSIAA